MTSKRAAMGGFFRRTGAATLLMAIALTATAGLARAATFTNIYSFPFLQGEPEYLIAGPHGMFYGATVDGGTFKFGTIFSLSPPSTHGAAWTTATLWSFGGPGDGKGASGLTLGGGGVLYGVTPLGGANNEGTVFSLTPPTSPGGEWTETVLWSFTGPDGQTPDAPLIADRAGVLYGTTYGGGAVGAGTVFSLTPPVSPGGPWTENVLWSFGGTSNDGIFPWSPLVADSNGTLYGATFDGEKGRAGVVYSLTPPSAPGGSWTEAVLHTFSLKRSGPPRGVILGTDGVLYGSTYTNSRKTGGAPEGGVFSLSPPATPGGTWTVKFLFAFPGTTSDSPDGRSPIGQLLLAKSGALYGTDEWGGRNQGSGTVFELKPPSTGTAWTIKVLHDFVGSDGIAPLGLIEKAGVLYGTTSSGTASDGGAVFSIVP